MLLPLYAVSKKIRNNDSKIKKIRKEMSERSILFCGGITLTGAKSQLHIIMGVNHNKLHEHPYLFALDLTPLTT